MSAVMPLRRLTEATYRAEREQIRATYGDSNAEAAAQRDQALAALYYRSGWTQEELAKVEGCSRQQMTRQLLFGRFLANAPTGSKPRNLTERRFRSYWERTDKTNGNERQRFAEVLRLMEEDTRINKSTAPLTAVGNAIVQKFADGKWHMEETIKAHVEHPPEQVDAVLFTMRSKGTYRTHCERKKSGVSWKYRIVRKSGKAVDLDVLRTELEPLLDGLEEEGKKNMATMSPGTVAMLAHQLRKLIEKLDK